MQFYTATIAYAAAALVLAFAPKAAYAGITAFDTHTCSGSAGLDVPCDGSCHDFTGRHSFIVDGGSGSHCVTAFVDAGCPTGGEGFTFQNEDGGCQDVNTGTSIKSFLCSSSNTCVL